MNQRDVWTGLGSCGTCDTGIAKKTEICSGVVFPKIKRFDWLIIKPKENSSRFLHHEAALTLFVRIRFRPRMKTSEGGGAVLGEKSE